jgi:phospholipase C
VRRAEDATVRLGFAMRTSFLACAFGLVGLIASSAAGCGSNDTTLEGTSNGTDGGPGSGGGDNADGSTNGGNPPGKEGGTSSNTDGGSTSGGEGGSGSGNPIKTVFVIMMENHSWSTISASSSAAYINDKTMGLVGLGGHAENYSTPKGNHPSEPNYLWLEGGQNFGITDDSQPKTNHQSSKDHLVTQLETAGLTWKAYAESITAGSCPLTDTSIFVTRHVPMLFFDDVTDTNSTSSAHCMSHIRPFTELATDLSGGTVANYNFITPNLCGDMHGQTTGTTCFGATSDLIKLGDDWLKANVPTILNSAAYKNNGALFVIWDEGDEPAFQTASDGPVPVFVLSPKGKPGYKSTTVFTHSSALRTFEEIFGLPLLGDAKNATDLSEFFTSFP